MSETETQPDSGAATATPEAPRQPAKSAGAQPAKSKPQSKPRNLPPYQVILLNDNDHTFHYVIELLMKVFGYEVGKALALTEQIHTNGRAVVWSGHKELAELKADQVKGYGPDFYAQEPVRYPLGCRVEAAPGG